MIKEKLCFVQFTHPGGEHRPDKGENFKSWNQGKHQRKFLMTDGDFIFENKLTKKKPLLFWGEWEPDSKIINTLEKPKGDYPRFIQQPIFDNSQPFPRQNTDPYIYGEQFHYCCCKQWRSGKPTQLAKLAQGSIILFGSTINQNTPQAYFALDTVFVVDNFIEYNDENYVSKLQGKVSENYFEITIKSAYDGTFEKQVVENKKPEVRCYFGASFNSKINGMYSFVPCKEYNINTIGFERVKLTNNDFDFITNNLNAAPKMNPVSNIVENVLRWERLKEIIKKQGFYEGINFNFNKR
jgi:hypothetical protein